MKRVIGILILVSFICLGGFFALYEKHEVSAHSWDKSYHPSKEEPFGMAGFLNILDAYYPDTRIVARYRDTLLPQLDSSGNLLISFNDYYNDYQFSESPTSIYNWISSGNDALILSDDFYFNNLANGHIINSNHYINDSIVNLNYCNNYTVLQDEELIYRSDSHYLDKKGSNLFGVGSSRYAAGFNPVDSVLDSLRALSLIEVDSSIIMMSIPMGAGKLTLHSLPSLLSNFAVNQEYYKAHLDYIVQHLPDDPKVIIIDHKIYNRFSDQASYSPIRFILDNPPLKWAYFLSLIAGILYIAFKGKRRQKAVPVINAPINSSMDFAKTLATLYAEEDSNEDLIPHLADLFYHHVEKNYFISKNDEYFVEKLARKTTFKKDKIEAIRAHFTNATGNYTISDYQLENIYKRLEEFYNHTT